jgi:hypothetical protein
MRIAVVSLAGMLMLGPSLAVAADSMVTASLRGSIDVEVVFTAEEIRIIRAHYQSGGHNGKPDGKHKQKGLPPGIEKNLARGKTLPPGIAKKALPDELRRVLPPVRDGHERIIVAGKILLVEIATQVVRDVLTEIILD